MCKRQVNKYIHCVTIPAQSVLTLLLYDPLLILSFNLCLLLPTQIYLFLIFSSSYSSCLHVLLHETNLLFNVRNVENRGWTICDYLHSQKAWSRSKPLSADSLLKWNTCVCQLVAHRLRWAQHCLTPCKKKNLSSTNMPFSKKWIYIYIKKTTGIHSSDYWKGLWMLIYIRTEKGKVKKNYD